MIYTVTLNPSVDYHVETPTLHVGEVNVAQRQHYKAGGKGINVSMALQNLHIKSEAFLLAGGFTGQFIVETLQEKGIVYHAVAVEEPTRINVKLKQKVETELNGRSPYVSEQVLRSLTQQLLDVVAPKDYVVLSGSLPESVAASTYATLLEQLESKGVYVVIDSKGKALEEALPKRPFLIKPNQHEVSEWLGSTISTPQAACNAGREMMKHGAEHVIVSMAGEGAVFVSEEVCVVANAPKGIVQHSIGAGDSVVAGFLAHYSQHGDLVEAFRYGVAAGSASAFSHDLCTKAEVEALVDRVTISPLD
ncbi:1-phosphofructokinase [Fictibacillus macauensis ZFHKF-1]|uniref:Tagatose-6-phosphate kinase n=1 Tax=Fictibacillus macauensis ZFHKF-1 TaxID=1196324 RepID=I8ALL2_9BACL|nr:1-phosphofructokinase [Fictibacillus macauensis]EIT86807.1 1-phosphofructokinase [Fictibacillus macauensis ZFHKF-1]